MRKATISRQTTETDINLTLVLEGKGQSDIATGIGFLDHMLTLFARHGLLDLQVACSGDVEVDGHHTTEDIGICLGKAIAEALGDKVQIRRYGTAFVPMDEALAMVSLDISARPYLALTAPLPLTGMAGTFDAQLVEEFFRAVSVHAGLTLHIRVLDGANLHHVIEAVFKAFGRALREAVSLDARIEGVNSTKGVL